MMQNNNNNNMMNNNNMNQWNQQNEQNAIFELQRVLRSFEDAYNEKCLNNRFKIPAYRYIGDMVQTAHQNQTQQMQNNSPDYQYLWHESHKHNPNPQQYSTTLITGLDAIEGRQIDTKKVQEEFKAHIN